ncbi:MAG TPA: protein-L-isoaspartate O-methyltransferase [Stellaceae bacterium]|nr:protein-L-isoaspartate O-methyltransferase [Stellaceae bacterium]
MSHSSVAARDEARHNMVDNQLRANKVHDDRVLDAFLRLRRELFLPPGLRGVAYIDEDLPVAPGRYLMEPMVAARLVQALAVQPKDAALVVGAGVGYEAAVLGLLARSVIALEEDSQLARIGRSALVDHRIASVTYVEAPLKGGHRARAPYDVILFGGAVAAIPDEISAQLAEGGRMSVVLREPGSVGRAALITRTGAVLARRVIFDAATPLLPGFEAEPGFEF